MIKLKDLMNVIPHNTICEVTYMRKKRPAIKETCVVEDIKFKEQYIVDEIQPYSLILKILVHERKK